MPIIALVGNKGGAGKTTLCVNLASALAERSSAVILDADPQRCEAGDAPVPALAYFNLSVDPDGLFVITEPVDTDHVGVGRIDVQVPAGPHPDFESHSACSCEQATSATSDRRELIPR